MTTALITGATSGIGRSMALEFAKRLQTYSCSKKPTGFMHTCQKVKYKG